jgi:hypothetical protein
MLDSTFFIYHVVTNMQAIKTENTVQARERTYEPLNKILSITLVYEDLLIHMQY